MPKLARLLKIALEFDHITDEEWFQEPPNSNFLRLKFTFPAILIVILGFRWHNCFDQSPTSLVDDCFIKPSVIGREMHVIFFHDVRSWLIRYTSTVCNIPLDRVSKRCRRKNVRRLLGKVIFGSEAWIVQSQVSSFN